MVGYEREDKAYCLELTYNYGVDSYPKGTGLSHFAVGVDEPEKALAEAKSLGYKVEGDMVTGPDGYCYRVLPQPSNRSERFLYVAQRVAELPKAVAFYGDVLGMNDLTPDFEHLLFNRGGKSMARIVGYQPEQVPILLFEDPGQEKPKLEQWEGRH